MLAPSYMYDWVYFKILRTKHVISWSFSMKGKNLLLK